MIRYPLLGLAIAVSLWASFAFIDSMYEELGDNMDGEIAICGPAARAGAAAPREVRFYCDDTWGRYGRRRAQIEQVRSLLILGVAFAGLVGFVTIARRPRRARESRVPDNLPES
jgi:hypothetical protein